MLLAESDRSRLLKYYVLYNSNPPLSVRLKNIFNEFVTDIPRLIRDSILNRRYSVHL